jgi:ADP-glucose pyrophosphorylase
MLRDLHGDHVLILAGDHMYRMDYRQLLLDHEEHEADVTIGVMPCSESEIASFGAARVNEEGRILEFREKPATPEDRAGMDAGRPAVPGFDGDLSVSQAGAAGRTRQRLGGFRS